MKKNFWFGLMMAMSMIFVPALALAQTTNPATATEQQLAAVDQQVVNCFLSLKKMGDEGKQLPPETVAKLEGMLKDALKNLAAMKNGDAETKKKVLALQQKIRELRAGIAALKSNDDRQTGAIGALGVRTGRNEEAILSHSRSINTLTESVDELSNQTEALRNSNFRFIADGAHGAALGYDSPECWLSDKVDPKTGKRSPVCKTVPKAMASTDDVQEATDAAAAAQKSADEAKEEGFSCNKGAGIFVCWIMPAILTGGVATAIVLAATANRDSHIRESRP